MMNATQPPAFTVGQQLKFKCQGAEVIGTFVQDYRGLAAISYEGQNWLRAYTKVTLVNAANTTNQNEAASCEAALVTKPVFDVNERFIFIENMVDMLVEGSEKSLIVTGSGGLGKSHTVFNRLKLHDLGEGVDYAKVSGHVTPKSLYRSLYDNNEKLIVFDDCDSVLHGDTCQNLLKAALDSYGSRDIHWLTEAGSSSDLPGHFNFTGRIIFISNHSLVDIPQPVVSRSLYVDVTMTPEEKITRIRAIAPALCPDLSDQVRTECINLIDKYKHLVADLNLRTLLKVASMRRANPRSWEPMSSYLLCAELSRQTY